MDTLEKSLWPTFEEIGTADYVAPVAIMREQAEAISKLTRNVLEGQVVAEKVMERPPVRLPTRNSGATSLESVKRPPAIDENKIKYVFLLRVSVLDGVKVRLFSVAHDIAFVYPTTITKEFIKSGKETKQVSDAKELQDFLREFFHSEEVKKVLQSLITQSVGPNDAIM